ncbi:MAG: FABP family protein [Acidimicrobiales bacterium]
MPDVPAAALAAEVAGLGFLLGTWAGEGEGRYPTIQTFQYTEEITFGHVGRPFLTYEQRTIRHDTGLPAHGEAGYLRPAPAGRVEFVLAHSTGIAEVEEGTVDGTRLELASTVVSRTATTKEVTAIERAIAVDGDVLHYTLRMAAVGHPLTHHLEAELHRLPKPQANLRS